MLVDSGNETIRSSDNLNEVSVINLGCTDGTIVLGALTDTSNRNMKSISLGNNPEWFSQDDGTTERLIDYISMQN